MCTTTWWRPGQEVPGYTVFFNRDEAKSRVPALPPQRRKTENGRDYIAPIDGARGGTWIAVNESGLTLAILNHDAAAKASDRHDYRSRGEIPLLLAGADDIAGASMEFESIESDQFRPFFLFAISPAEGPVLWEWNGDILLFHEDLHQPITTSSFDSERVVRSRHRLFQSLLPKPPGVETLEAFHHSTDSEEGALGIRMRRPDAQTVSLSRIDVSPGEVRFAYRPELIDSDAILPTGITTIPLKGVSRTR